MEEFAFSNLNEINKILCSVLPDITPSIEEKAHINNVISELVALIQSAIIPEQLKINFIEPQGSTGIKDTALHNAADIDLFIGLEPDFILKQQFPSKITLLEFLHPFFKKLCQNWLIPLLRASNINDINLAYAEHPYLSIKYKNLEIDLVFCFDLPGNYIEEKGPITAVDRSPHHSRFIRDRLTTDQRNDVRLLKHFFKCNFIYGDKSPIGQSGFTGYSAELLISYYGSLMKVFQSFHGLDQIIIGFSNWKKRIQNQNLNVQTKIFEKDFLQIVDPTDSNRNVGASISPRCFLRAKDLIEKFLINPEKKYFEKRDLPRLSTFNLSQTESAKYFFVFFKQTIADHYTKYRDKCYSQLNKFILSALWEPLGFSKFSRVTGELIFDADEGIYCISIFTNTPKIESKYLRKGPHQDDLQHSNKFLEKNPTAYLKENFYWVEVQRQYSLFSNFIDAFFRSNSIKGLEIQKIGCAFEKNYPILCDKAMGILYEGVLPYIDWDADLYRKSPYSVDNNIINSKSPHHKKRKK